MTAASSRPTNFKSTSLKTRPLRGSCWLTIIIDCYTYHKDHFSTYQRPQGSRPWLTTCFAAEGRLGGNSRKAYPDSKYDELCDCWRNQRFRRSSRVSTSNSSLNDESDVEGELFKSVFSTLSFSWSDEEAVEDALGVGVLLNGGGKLWLFKSRNLGTSKLDNGLDLPVVPVEVNFSCNLLRIPADDLTGDDCSILLL